MPIENPTQPFAWKSFLAPKHWPTWFGLSLLWLISRLPYDTQLSLGRKIGMLAWHILPSRRKVTLTNLTIAFPDMANDERIELAKEAYSNIGMSISENASLWFRPADFYVDRFTLVGSEHIDAALKKNRGVILLQAHFSLLEMHAALLGPLYPISAVFDPPKNPLFDSFLARQRERYMQSVIDNRQIRRMVKKIKQGEIVWYSPDQSVSRAHGGIETRFFGYPVLTTAGTRRIAAMTGAIVLPVLPTRHANGVRYTIAIGEPLDFVNDDDQQVTQQVNDLFETQVRSQPEQYFWMHKRFKPVSPNHPDPYKKEKRSQGKS